MTNINDLDEKNISTHETVIGNPSPSSDPNVFLSPIADNATNKDILF